MPSRLSSLLVRDGLVGVKRMEKAFQRQVIYGGSLDTILLEMNLVPEERLTQYLALASGLPPAKRDEADRATAAALATLSPEVAQQFRAVPLGFDGEALRVLVCSPLEINELEDLADLLDRPLQPLITPEYRWHLAFAKVYEAEPPARFTTLARTLEIETAPAPVGRTRSVIVDTAPIAATMRPPASPAGPLPIPTPVAQDSPTMKVGAVIPGSTKKRNTLVGINVVRTTDPPPLGVPRSRGRNDGVPEEPLPPPKITFVSPQPTLPIATPPRPAAANRAAARLAATPKRAPSGSIPTVGRDSPLAIVRARELLATAEDRDTVFLTLLRAARSKARYAALLTVQGGAVIGRVALAEAGVDVGAIANVLIPLDVVSPFRSVVNNQQPHIGSLGSTDPAIDAMVIRLGGAPPEPGVDPGSAVAGPPSALILPIVLRDRVVAIVVAHRVHSDLKLVDVAELLPLGNAAADALGRLIVKHKAAGYRAPEVETIAAPNVPIDPAEVATKRLVKVDPDTWSAPSAADQPPVPPFEPDDDAELSITTEPPQPIDAVLDRIETANEGDAEDELNEAVERDGESLRALVKRFPGRLRVDRFSVGGRPLRAAQYGGLLELVVRLGSVASELLIDKMSDAQRDVRFFATICTSELRPRSAVFALVERLFDQDFGVRATAIEALSGYPLQDLSQPLARVRRALHSTDPEVVAAASAAVVALGDIDSIGDLIGAIERQDRAGEHIRKALASLTAQDFGAHEKKWRRWYEGARKHHRIEWLIDGLSHKDDPVREAAIADLRRLTGEYFGYHHDLPRKDREASAVRWTQWWRETGMRRFVLPREDERMRPTGVLPTRRDDES
ncbi:MAG: HEAT repeat domain-containing protein [Kofleriaceae bacterium]